MAVHKLQAAIGGVFSDIGVAATGRRADARDMDRNDYGRR